MSAFNAGSVIGKLGLDVSEYSEGMRESTTLAGNFAEELGHILAEATGSPLLGELANGIGEVVAAASEGNWAETFAAGIHLAGDATAGFLEIIRSQADQFHEFSEAAEKFGTSVEFMSTVGKAAKASSLDLESLGMGMKFMEDRAANATDGNKEAIKAFGELGISAGDLAELLKSPEELLYRVADGMAGIEDPTRRVQAATDLLSKAGAGMIPFLSQGSTAIKEFAQQIKDMGGDVTEQDAQMGDDWSRLSTLFSAEIDSMEKEAAKPFIKLLTDNADTLVADGKEFSDWCANTLPGAAQAAADAIHGIGVAMGALDDHFVKTDKGNASTNWTDYFGDDYKQALRDSQGSFMGDVLLGIAGDNSITPRRLWNDLWSPDRDGTYPDADMGLPNGGLRTLPTRGTGEQLDPSVVVHQHFNAPVTPDLAKLAGSAAEKGIKKALSSRAASRNVGNALGVGN